MNSERERGSVPHGWPLKDTLPRSVPNDAENSANPPEGKLTGQKHVRSLEKQRNTKRRALFDAQYEIDRQRERLIAEIEGKLPQQASLTTLFMIR